MRASRDGGRTWLSDTEIVIYSAGTSSQRSGIQTMQQAWAEQGQFSIGLPDIVVLPNGDALIVYYAGPSADQTGIHWARAETRI